MRINFIAIGWLLALPCAAQSASDIIYQSSSEPIACYIADVSSSEIKYKQLDNREGPDHVLSRSKAVLLFRYDGEFLIPDQQEGWIAGADRSAHKIVTKGGAVYPANYLEVEEDQLTYQHAQSNQRYTLATDEVLVVIYKDGRHQLLAPPREVVQGLGQVAHKLDEYSSPADEETSAVISGDDQVLELSDEQKTHFEKMAMVKANDFGKYLDIISNKEEVEEDKLVAVEHATKLFVSDSSKIQVSTLSQAEKQQYTVPIYLDRLRMLPYDRVELIWVKAQMVSKFRKGMDGRYYGMIAAQQLFRGYLDNKIVYQDVTEKDVEVVLDQYVVFDEGQARKKWNVLLSSVNVKQTREK